MGAGLGRKGGVVRWSTATRMFVALGPDPAGRRSGRRGRRVPDRAGPLGRRRGRRPRSSPAPAPSGCCRAASRSTTPTSTTDRRTGRARGCRDHRDRRRQPAARRWPCRSDAGRPSRPPSRPRRPTTGRRTPPGPRHGVRTASSMNIDWAALGSVFGVSLVVTVALVGLFTLGIVGPRQAEPTAQRPVAAPPAPWRAHRRVRLLRAVRGGRRVRDLPDRRLTPSPQAALTVGRGAYDARVARRGPLCVSAHSPAAGQRRVDGRSRGVVDCRSQLRRQERKPVRIRRGPATVTGERLHTEVTVRHRGLEGRRTCGSGSQETLVAGHVEPGRGP